MQEKSTTRIKLGFSFWAHPFCVPFSEDVLPSSLFLKNQHYLVIDIETKNTFQDVGGIENIAKLEVSVACAYDSQSGKFLSFRESELEKLFDLCYRRLVIGYNIRGFDLKVLEAYGLKTKKLDFFDIMGDVETLTRQRYLKLEYLTRGTLGEGKTAEGLQAVQWWKEGRIDLITEYCLQDVQITHRLFEYGRRNGHVKIQRSEDSIKEVPVQWN